MRKIPCGPRPEAEALEDRWLPSVMSFTAPTGNGDDAWSFSASVPTAKILSCTTTASSSISRC